MIAIAAAEIKIQAGEASHRIRSSYTVSRPAEAVSIRPLLYPFVKSLEATVYRPDGTVEVLVWAKDYRYDWQQEYEFKNNVPLPKGSRIQVTAYVDNSDNNTNNPNKPAQSISFSATLCQLRLVYVNR
jgi:hypothetical protein